MPDAAPERTKRQKILHRTRVGLTLAICVGLLLWGAAQPSFGTQLTAVFAAVLTLVSIFEIERMRLFPSATGAIGSAAGMATCLALFWFRGSAALDLVIAAAAGAAVGIAITLVGAKRTDASRVAAHIIIPLAALPLLFLFPLRMLGGAGSLAAFVGLAKIGDIAGYYAGSAIGKRRPFPRLSPGKTVAGCVASLMSGMLVGGLLAHLGAFGEARYGILSGLIFGALVNVTAQAGDLAESALKRRAGVKDSGTTFGPSGGMLDLVDSFLFAAPLAALVGPLLFHWSLR